MSTLPAAQPARHYVVVPVDNRVPPHTACGLYNVPGRAVTTLDFAEVTCARCRAYCVDLALTRGRPVPA